MAWSLIITNKFTALIKFRCYMHRNLLNGVPDMYWIRERMKITMTSKQRAYLKGLAMTMEPIFQIGKASVTPELTTAISEALEARELIKISVLKNCLDDGRSIAEVLAERTHSEVVQVIGKKIVLYKPAKEEKKRKIVLPK